ncbi:hypothetical protein BDW62DRAFT_189788 [Aspergillus aurantiobrunneus]
MCLEILRGNLMAMQAHFDSGIRLLRQLQHRDRLPTTQHTVLVKHESEVVDDHLVDVFARLNLQVLMLGHGSQQKETFVPSFRYGRQIRLPRVFCSVGHARQSLSPILLSVIYLIKGVERLGVATEPSAAMLARQKALQEAISEWNASYNYSVTSQLASITPQEKLGHLMLRVYSDVSTVLLATCFSIRETAYDAHLPVFQSMVQRYSSFYAQLEKSNCDLHPFFIIETCLFPPLYFAALKCRHQSTRHQAIALLRQCHHVEGPWTGPMVAKVAAHVVALERHFEKSLKPSSSSSQGSSLVLPEFCRIQCVECKLPGRRDQDPYVGTLTLKRFRHELGKEGGWCVSICTVNLATPLSSP